MTEQKTAEDAGRPSQVNRIMALATKMMRDSWTAGNDAAWQPAYQELESVVRAALAAQPAGQAAISTDGATEKHHRDSAELRRLCQARDDARRERDALKAEVKRLTPGHNRYQFLRQQPLDRIAAGGVFAGKTPDNLVLNGDDLDAAIDAALSHPHSKGGDGNG